jgi:hypothetical protein
LTPGTERKRRSKKISGSAAAASNQLLYFLLQAGESFLYLFVSELSRAYVLAQVSGMRESFMQERVRLNVLLKIHQHQHNLARGGRYLVQQFRRKLKPVRARPEQQLVQLLREPLQQPIGM